MDEPLAHMGPLPLPEGVVFSPALSDRVLLATGVRVQNRSRSQWGQCKVLNLSGPMHRLEEALTLTILSLIHISEPTRP